MKTLLACFGTLISFSAFAQPFEIRFHPVDRIYAYPLDEHARYRSVQLQNATIINRSGEAVAIAAVDIELVAPPSVVESRRFEGAELERIAKAGLILQSSGMMEALRFQFGGEALVPAGVKMAEGAVLQPGEALLLARQMFAMRGNQTELRIRVRALASGQLLESAASVRIIAAESTNAYRFPLQGVWYVGAGPSIHSHHRTVVAQEYALDLLQFGENGRTHRGDGTRRGDYLAYGARVVASAPGQVIAAVGDQEETDEDLRRPGEALDAYMSRVRQTQMGRIGRGTHAVIGNHVVIAHERGEHSVYAHLKPGSLKVKVGDRVKAGDLLGDVGTSGNSTEPHLHFHVCDAPEPLLCAGIPAKFDGIDVANADSPRPLQTGDIVISR
ncbi:MAG TPA: M23 family metallopeptidase [Usitatibacter sp.]|nr:M23 family metallopeptidase [Usitatibacter sp.]